MSAPVNAPPSAASTGPDVVRRRVIVVVITIVVLIVVLNLIALALDSAVGGHEPGGASGSSYATGSEGLAAYARLLADYGHPVRRQRGKLSNAALPPGTLIITESNSPAPLESDELATVSGFLAGGGRVVLAGLGTHDIGQITGGRPPQRITATDVYRDFAPPLGAVRAVSTDARSAFDGRDIADGQRVLARQGDRVLLYSTSSGGGAVYVLADASPLENAFLGRLDNAAFGLALPRDDGAVTFAEGVHGYGERSGLSAIPSRWKIALTLIAVAAIVFAWSRARRLGPPDRPARELPPVRSVYVDALADTLERTDDRARALAPLGEWARGRVKARAGLAADADRDEVMAAARRLGWTDAEIAALWQPPATDDEVLALGRIVTRVTDERT
jgi:hypothetical protein